MLPTDGVIVRDPDILGGTAVFRGTRVPFKNLLDYLEGGHTLDEFLEEFPSVSREAAIAALEHAKLSADWVNTEIDHQLRVSKANHLQFVLHDVWACDSARMPLLPKR